MYSFITMFDTNFDNSITISYDMNTKINSLIEIYKQKLLKELTK